MDLSSTKDDVLLNCSNSVSVPEFVHNLSCHLEHVSADTTMEYESKLEADSQHHINTDMNNENSVPEVFIKEEQNDAYYAEEESTDSSFDPSTNKDIIEVEPDIGLYCSDKEETGIPAASPNAVTEPESAPILKCQLELSSCEPTVDFHSESRDKMKTGMNLGSSSAEVFIKEEQNNSYYPEEEEEGGTDFKFDLSASKDVIEVVPDIGSYCSEKEEMGDSTLMEGEQKANYGDLNSNPANRSCDFADRHCDGEPGQSRLRQDDVLPFSSQTEERIIKQIKLSAQSKASKLKKKPFLCHLCEYSSSSKSVLKQHILAIHTNEKPYSCPHCAYSGTQRYKLKIHIINKHSQEKPFTCPYCYYATSQHCDLKRHIMAKHTHEKPYTCPHCDYAASRHGHIKRHVMAVHTQEKPYKCPHCDYASSQYSDLKKHIVAKHTLEKPYTCPHCEYVASRQGHLKKHIMAKHTLEKPYTCPNCDYAASQHSNLKRHVITKHS